MSWLFKSLQFDDPDSSTSSSSSSNAEQHPRSPTNRGGVKDDLSSIGETIGRQFRGVANFLAPPPSSPPVAAAVAQRSADSDSDSSPSSQTLLGIRNDLAEIGGSLKSGLSLLSSNKAVSGITKLTSNFLHFQEEDEEDEDEDEEDCHVPPGITKEVIAFVKEISVRPECWTDFPLTLQNDFKMSDDQREHALTIEHIIPSLATVKDSLHTSMGDGQFWMVYFILLLPRLNQHDSERLSTPQIVETRNILLEKLQNKRNVKVESCENTNFPETSKEGTKVNETQKDNIQSSKKEVTETLTATRGLEIDDEENTEQWFEETDAETGTSVDDHKMLKHEEDVSFSDLEDDDNGLSTRLSASRQAQNIRAPSPSGSSDWDKLNESSETQIGQHKARQSVSRDNSDVESNDWLKVDFD